MVAQRTREIGLRMALGSSVGKAIAYVAGAGARASAAGLVIGLSLCVLALPVMRSVLYGVAVFDPPTLLAVTATLALITLAATLLPALRIARIDPATTLRDE